VAIQNRIKEFEEDHKVLGGSHMESMGGGCPTCKIIVKLQGIKKILGKPRTKLIICDGMISPIMILLKL